MKTITDLNGPNVSHLNFGRTICLGGFKCLVISRHFISEEKLKIFFLFFLESLCIRRYNLEEGSKLLDLFKFVAFNSK